MYKFFIAITLIFLSATSYARAVEVSVVTDWETVSYYGSVEETESVIQTVFEYAGNIFSEQLNIELTVVYLDIPSSASEDLVAKHTHAKFLIDELFTYRNSIPEHYSADLMVLVTKRNLAIGGQDLAGYANIKYICSAKSIAMIELFDNGLDGQTLAHEIAHVMGAVHDGEVPCETTGRGYLMSSSVHNGSDYFSQCSIDTINETLEIFGDCLEPKPDSKPPVIIPPRKGGGGSIDLLFILLLILTAWQSGNARDCKSRFRRFESDSRLQGRSSCGTKVRVRSSTIRIVAT